MAAEPPGSAQEAVDDATTPPDFRDLTIDEIRTRLTLTSPELAKELLDTAKEQFDADVGRQGRLDAKANSLITAAGLSLTVATSLSGALGKGQRLPGPLLASFACTAFLGLASVCLAVFALKVRPRGTLHSGAIFNQGMLDMAEAPSGADDLADKPAERNAFGLALYRQYMTVHVWEAYQINADRLDKKGRVIESAQILFMTFLVALLACETWLFVVQSASAGEATTPACPATAEGPSGRGRPSGEKVGNAMPDKPLPPPKGPPPLDRREVRKDDVFPLRMPQDPVAPAERGRERPPNVEPPAKKTK